MRPVLLFVLLLLFFTSVKANEPVKGKAVAFIQNKNQWHQQILFTANLPQGWLFLEQNQLTYNFLEPAYFNVEDTNSETATRKELFKGHAFRINFIGANPQAKVTPANKLPGYRNYFIGREAATWATGVPAFEEITYAGLFPNIDLHLYQAGSNLKYDYVVAPQGQISLIRMQYEGVKKLALQNGRLFIQTSVNEIIEEKPYAYQIINGLKKEVPCVFTLAQNTVGFKLTGPYNPNLPLIIDPEVIFVTYAGASSGLSANCATGDAAGNVYFASRTLGPVYPVSPGAYQTQRRGNNNAISKLTPDGKTLVYATYLGGSGSDEYPLSLVVNPQNELIILGHTSSFDFPVSATALDKTLGGARDYFVSRLSADGTNLVASTLLGGSEEEGGVIGSTPAKLALDGTGNIYVGGCTQSFDFRIQNGFQSARKGGVDGIVCKLNSSLTTLIWSTFIGGEAEDLIYDIKVGSAGNIYVAGGTTSAEFPTTSGVVQKTRLSQRDGFLAIIGPTGNQLQAATYLGTRQNDFVKALDIDKDGNIYAAGYTSGSYPITPGTYGTANSNGGYFIHKLNGTLTGTAFSTHLGSNNTFVEKAPTAFRVNACGNIYLAGYGLTAAPLSADALEQTNKTMYVCHFDTDAKRLVYGSYLGGTETQAHTHLANSSLITEDGMLYQIECTYSRDQPVTAGAYDGTYFSSPDGAVTKFKFTPVLINQVKALAEAPPVSCAPYTVSFKNNSEHGLTYTWNFGDNSPNSNEANPSHTFQQPGNYRVKLLAFNPASCIPRDSVFINVQVAEPLTPVLPKEVLYLCNQQVTLDAGNPGFNYLWSTGATTQIITVAEPGTYAVKISLGACQITDSITVATPLPKLEVPTIFTPNKDGRNDYFVIRNSGVNTKLKIYNRWGHLVYQSNNYQNDWDGRNVTQGTYFYHVESAENCTTKKGWLEIVW
ncbi:MAG: gliding motility-associated C-terminal domain-containing protein [Adhaeribacter sp.]